MNDAVREYTSLITDIKQELTDLKTAHLRPLGALNFFSDSTSFTVQLQESYGTYYRDFEVVVTIETPTTAPPIVQSGWDTPPNFYTVQFLNFAVSSDYTTWTYRLSLLSATGITSATMNFHTLSSQPINSITWRYVS